MWFDNTCGVEEGGRDESVTRPVEGSGERHGPPLGGGGEYLGEDDPGDGAEAEGVGANEAHQGREGKVAVELGL